MKTATTIMILCTKDIMKVTGKSERTARRIARRIKLKHNAAYVTLETFCIYTGFPEEKLFDLLR